jgi:hypothetical protein
MMHLYEPLVGGSNATSTSASPEWDISVNFCNVHDEKRGRERRRREGGERGEGRERGEGGEGGEGENLPSSNGTSFFATTFSPVIVLPSSERSTVTAIVPVDFLNMSKKNDSKKLSLLLLYAPSSLFPPLYLSSSSLLYLSLSSLLSALSLTGYFMLPSMTKTRISISSMLKAVTLALIRITPDRGDIIFCENIGFWREEEVREKKEKRGEFIGVAMSDL